MKVRTAIWLTGLGGWLAVAWGCGGAPTNDAAVKLFALDHLLDVRIEIAPGDWDKLRLEHHDLLAALGPKRFENPAAKPYKTYKADVTIDGVGLKAVGVRKRAFLGSASCRRPSLGIRLDEFDQNQRLAGLRRLSLNNNLQDPSLVHQALAYAVFAKAGVPAPRCNFARVTVNGNFLGVYSHVEAVEDEFLKRHFGDARGHLYEGQLVDFRTDWLKGFERKNRKSDTNWNDLEAVAKALQAGNQELLAQLEPLVHLDAYLTYWAVESLIGHWDSYSNNGNNFFVYRVPATGKFQFIPWGADSVFGDRDPFTPAKTPESVKARSLLPYRLYQLPPVRERYRERLRQVLKTAWNERELLATVDRLEALLQPHTAAARWQFQAGLQRVRQFIRARRAALEAELAGPAPEWPLEPKTSVCLTKVGTLSAVFSTTWLGQRRPNEVARTSAKLWLELDGQELDVPSARISTALSQDTRTAGCAVISFVSFQWLRGQVQVPVLVIEPELFKAGAKLPVDGYAVAGILFDGRVLEFNIKSLNLLLGTLELKEAGMEPGGKLRGKLEADIYRIPR